LTPGRRFHAKHLRALFEKCCALEKGTTLSSPRGYALTPEWKLGTLAPAPHVDAFFARYDIDRVLDVGSNFGQAKGNQIRSSEDLARFVSLHWSNTWAGDRLAAHA